MNTSLRLRLWLSIAATAVARLVLIGYNFLLVPMLLYAWGVPGYGEWVVLTSVAALASMSNVGFVQASSSELILRIASGDRDRAYRVLSTTVVCLSGLFAVAAAGSAALLWLIDARSLFGPTVMPGIDAKFVVWLSLLTVIAGFFTGPFASLAGVSVGPGPSQAVLTAVKIGELIAAVITVRAGGGPVLLSILLFLTPVLSTIGCWLLSRRELPWLKVFPLKFDLQILREMLHPSISQFTLFISVNLLAIQVPRIVIAHLGGTATVAMFAIAVTYARTPRQLSGFIGQSFQIELSRSYSEGNLRLLGKMFYGVSQMVFWLSVLLSIFLLSVSRSLIQVWTHGTVSANVPLLIFLFSGSVIGSYSDVIQYALSGINRVSLVAKWHVIGILSALIFSILTYKYIGVLGMGAGLIVPEITSSLSGITVMSILLKSRVDAVMVNSILFSYTAIKHEASRIRVSLLSFLSRT